MVAVRHDQVLEYQSCLFPLNTNIYFGMQIQVPGLSNILA
jgi:hypothetical protein